MRCVRKRQVSGLERCPDYICVRIREVSGKERWPEKKGDRKRRLVYLTIL